MVDVYLTEEHIGWFEEWLQTCEKSPATIAKYLLAARKLAAFAKGHPITKTLLAEYKQQLVKECKSMRTVNGVIAALNCLANSLNCLDLKLQTQRVQRQVYCPEEKELTRQEYQRLLRAAQSMKKRRLFLLLQTICCTGIRVSELRFITVEAAKRGEALVICKGKTRTVLLIRKLQKELLRYAASIGVASGSIFVTRTGKPIDRTAIWREMKALCLVANVVPDKVFPHNLRHLFARAFYQQEKDIAKLADILGHSNIDTTRIYLITTGVEHRRRMERLHLMLE